MWQSTSVDGGGCVEAAPDSKWRQKGSRVQAPSGQRKEVVLELQAWVQWFNRNLDRFTGVHPYAPVVDRETAVPSRQLR
jgi:hypothetical protein